MKKKKLLFIAVPSILVVAFLILILAGVFRSGDPPSDLAKYDRPRIMTAGPLHEPANLSEFLNSDKAAAEVLLSSENLRNQLMNAKSLAEIADSRLAMANLRSLRNDTAAWMESLARDAKLAADARPSGSDYVMAAAQVSTVSEQLASISDKLDLFLAPSVSASGPVSPQVELKGTWAQPDDVLLLWTPHDEWIPDNGYRLFRVVNGQSALIAENLGALNGLSARVAKTAAYADMIGEAFGMAALTPAKMDVVGVKSPAEFAELVYSGGVANGDRARVSGEKDFVWIRDRMLTIPGTTLEKLPAIDALQRQTLQVGLPLEQTAYSLSDTRLAGMSALSLKQAPIVRGYDKIAGLPDGVSRLAQVNEIMEARNAILAKSFTDSDFARDAGLGFHDSLAPLKLPKGTVVTYRLETSDG